MALDPLATVADLEALGVDVADEALVEKLLAAASDAVRDAAGVAISQLTSTITIPGTDGQWLTLPGAVVTDVEAVAADGDPVTDYRVYGTRLWRACGWASPCGPAEVTVTYTHGLPEIPEDIVALVCSIVAGAIARAEDHGFAGTAGIQAEKIDDYSVTHETGGRAVSYPVEIPDLTRSRLRARFGGSVAVVGSL